MKIEEILEAGRKLKNSERYKNARQRIVSWKEKLKDADAAAAKGIEDESAKFFHALKSSDPAIYTMLRVEINQLQEQIVKKLTGRDIIID